MTSSSSSSQQALWAMCGAMMLSGMIGLLVKTSQMDEVSLTFFRCLIGSAGLWLYCRYKGYRLPRDRRSLLLTAIAGLCLVLNWVCLFIAYRYVPVAVATVIYNTQPFMLLLASAVLTGERISRRSLLWMAVAFVGVILVSGLLHDQQQDAPWWLGGYALLAAALYTVTSLLTRQVRAVPAAMQAATQLSLCLLPLGAYVLLADVHWTSVNWLSVSLLGVLNTVVQYLWLYFAIQYLAMERLTVLSFVYPATALAVDILYFHEHFSLLQLIGMGLIVVANLAVLLKKQTSPAKPMVASAQPAQKTC